MASSTVRFVMSDPGMRAMLNEQFIRDYLTPRADRVLAAAKASAPFVTGEYRDGLHVEQATTDRVCVQVAGGSDHDLEVEAATGNLLRALGAA